MPEITLLGVRVEEPRVLAQPTNDAVVEITKEGHQTGNRRVKKGEGGKVQPRCMQRPCRKRELWFDPENITMSVKLIKEGHQTGNRRVKKGER